MYVCIYICDSMGRMQIVLSTKTEYALRKKANEKFGFKKGSISKAMEKAVNDWIKKEG